VISVSVLDKLGPMANISGSNQRKFPRVDLDMPVLVVGRGGHKQARMVNVSLGGCQLEGALDTRVGEILSISCGGRVLTEGFQAKIVWSKKTEDTINFGGCFWGSNEEMKRELVHRLIAIAHPENPRAAHLLMGD
jgi:hypothetical protein